MVTLCRYKVTKNFWTQHIATGVIASVSQGISAGSGYDALGKFASEALSTFAYNAFDGKGFTDDYGDMHGAFNWQSFAPKAEYVGMFLGKMAGDYLSAENVDKTQDSSKSSSPVGGTDPLSGVEDMLGAAWQGLKGIKDSIKDIQDKITELTGEKFDDFTGGLLRGANEGLFGFGENIGEGFTAFAQRTGNWISDGLFGNELEPVVGYGRVAGYEPDLKEINLPTLRSNTNAQKLINNLAAQHGVDPNDMMEILIASNGVESVDDLQQLIRDGVQLKSVENFGWEKGMQDKYYADYDKMQNGKLDINASLRQAELATHPETVRLYNKQHGQEDELNLTPGMRVSRGDATGDPELEVISYINDNYNQRGMSGVEGMQIMRLDVGDGTQVELVVNRAYWAQKNENEHPTYETDDGEYYQLSENENTKLTSRQGITKPHNEFYPYKIDTNGKEDEIFLHSGFQSEGCFVTGGRLSRPDNNSIRFNQYIRQAIGSNSYLKTTHRVIDVRSRDLKKRYPLP